MVLQRTLAVVETKNLDGTITYSEPTPLLLELTTTKKDKDKAGNEITKTYVTYEANPEVMIEDFKVNEAGAVVMKTKSVNGEIFEAKDERIVKDKDTTVKNIEDFRYIEQAKKTEKLEIGLAETNSKLDFIIDFIKQQQKPTDNEQPVS